MTSHADRDKSEPWWPPSATREPTINDQPIGQPGGAPGGNPLHRNARDRDADHTVPTDDERISRYAEAIDNLTNHLITDWSQWLEDVTAAVMATADAEQAELLAENERLRAGLYPLTQWTPESAMSLAQDVGASEDSLIVQWVRQRQRAEAAEAKVARVEALADAWELHGPGSAIENVMGQQSVTVGTAVRMLRAALAGPAKPEATEGGA